MSSIRTEIENHVALVTLDNAPVNAAALDMLQELTDVFDSFNDRDDVRVAVLTGPGLLQCRRRSQEPARPVDPRQALEPQPRRPRSGLCDCRLRQAGDRRGQRPGTRRRA